MSAIFIYIKQHLVCLFISALNTTWDFENPTIVDLPTLNPEKLQPAYSIIEVNRRFWVATGSFISLLDGETFDREVSLV